MNLERFCQTCHKQITRRVHGSDRGMFCSRQCSAESQKNKSSPWRYCGTCKLPKAKGIKGNECQPCRNKKAKARISSKTLKELRDFYGLAAYHAKIRGYSRSSYNGPMQCFVCGYAKHVDVCHIDDLKSFPESATIGEVNSPDNLIALCKNHHWEFDNGKLDDDKVLPIKS